ncbi:MAG: hypothetical protein LBM12_01335 [Candidatus Nomurabacteria bacterium]|jgi:hypothetical protein|nr:hypothetical protein [Candidatus Nomurabacteria bacterium]
MTKKPKITVSTNKKPQKHWTKWRWGRIGVVAAALVVLILAIIELCGVIEEKNAERQAAIAEMTAKQEQERKYDAFMDDFYATGKNKIAKGVFLDENGEWAVEYDPEYLAEQKLLADIAAREAATEEEQARIRRNPELLTSYLYSAYDKPDSPDLVTFGTS